ncbi:MAG: hypothetical protein P4N41_16665 [Negativicutes bacterium]|nr:hypothetical protein [Negativicutes bacterium]MDR3591288.1 hypothetical protein [Negativicutes bacterium]
MYVKPARTRQQEDQHERGRSLYKAVLAWQKEKYGAHGPHSRQAAIGLPDAVDANQAWGHRRRFLACARKDGVPMEVLAQIILKQLLDRRLRSR